MTTAHKACAIVAAGFIMASCVSGPDMYIAKEVSAEDKADFLFKQGVDKYNELLVEKNDLTSISRVRKFFENALVADPLHPQAESWIAKVDAFSAKRRTAYLNRVKALKDKDKRTAAENYEMVQALKLAGDIKADAEYMKLKMSISGTRSEVINTRVTKLSSIETKILAEKKSTSLAKLVPQANKLNTEITNVDPGNSDAKRSMGAIDAHISALAQADLDSARKLLDAKRFGESETALLKAERTVGGLKTPIADDIKALKYQLYIRWGNALYALKKYGPADEKAAKALSISKTTEAANLKQRINKASSARDYDAEINDILAEIDGSISRGELATAWSQIDRNAARMTKQANKDKIESRREAVTAALKPIYDEAIAAYNEEDYELAKEKLRVVVRIQPNYEQASGYLDRTNSKLKALSGAE